MFDHARCFIRRSAAIGAIISSGCLCTVAQAASVSAGPSTVLGQSMFSYSTFGSDATHPNADVVFQLTNNPVSQCFGFWLRASDPGFKNNFAVLLSVIQTQGQITVNADDSAANHWAGSTTAYCIVTSLQL
jgi:hypothetical protein